MSKLKSNWLLILMLIIVFLTYLPSLSIPLLDAAYTELIIIIEKFGNYSRNLSLFNPPISYYFSLYGTSSIFDVLRYKIFEFNSFGYYLTALIFRLTAVISIYHFVTKRTDSKLAGFIASIFFGVSFPGIQNTIRVSLSTIYLAITFLFIFLDKWWEFHLSPTRKKAIYSVLLFLLTFFTYAARMSSVLLIVLIGETYWFFKSHKNTSTFPLRLKHFLAFIAIFLILAFVLKTISKTPELEFKMISPKILFYSLFTGYPPAITTLWLFISNLIISPQVLIMRYIDKYLLHTIINLLPIIASIFLIINLIKKRFLLAFATLTIITFPIFVENSKLYLTNWDSLWISSTQLGGSIFLWFLLIMIFFIWNKDRKLAEVGLLGIIIIFINLMAPWMLSIQTSSDDQSAFNFIHRYYTLPAVGMGLLSSAIFVFFINLAKTNFIDYINKLKQKSNFLIISQKILYSIAYLILPSIIICSIILQAFISYNFLTEAHRGGTSDKIESYWTDIKPIFENIKPDQTTVIYTENNGNLDESYIKGIFPLRVGIYLGQIQNIPKVKFIFNQKEIENIDPQNFYAFSFDGKNIVSIKDKVLKSITQ